MAELTGAQSRLIDEAAAASAGPASLSDIQHVVILIQENRSFDHYFGTLCRCLGPGRSVGLVLGRGRLGGQFAGGGAGRRLPGRVGSEGEAGYRAERGERGRGDQDVIEAAGGAGAGGVGDRGAGGGRDRGGYPGAGAGGHGGGQPRRRRAGRAGPPARAGWRW